MLGGYSDPHSGGGGGGYDDHHSGYGKESPAKDDGGYGEGKEDMEDGFYEISCISAWFPLVHPVHVYIKIPSKLHCHDVFMLEYQLDSSRNVI